MIIYKYVLHKDRNITLHTCDENPLFYLGNGGKIEYAQHQEFGRYIVCENDDTFVSQVWFKERDDGKAIRMLLKDRKSRKIINKYDEKIKKAYKKASAKECQNRRGRHYQNSTSYYLKQYLLKFTDSEKLITRLMSPLVRYYGICSLTDFINKPISLIELKNMRNIGMKTVELYAKAYYNVPKQLIHSKD